MNQCFLQKFGYLFLNSKRRKQGNFMQKKVLEKYILTALYLSIVFIQIYDLVKKQSMSNCTQSKRKSM